MKPSFLRNIMNLFFSSSKTH